MMTVRMLEYIFNSVLTRIFFMHVCMYVGPFSCSNVVANEDATVTVSCLGPDGSPPPITESLICSLNDGPMFNCKLEN